MTLGTGDNGGTSADISLIDPWAMIISDPLLPNSRCTAVTSSTYHRDGGTQAHVKGKERFVSDRSIPSFHS